jgi:bifunctional non-homologous end joining protein LigD
MAVKKATRKIVEVHSAKEASSRKKNSKSILPADSPSDLVDEQLARYRSMRDFNVTAEPSGSSSQSLAGLPFCVQKHAASHLHYDFRLGWNGVLKSWAVAKGPSYFTGDKRLAVQVEDHPIEYGGFEGVIPKGQYGGGIVMLWDQGTWEPQADYPDVDAGLHDGSLKFILHGEKLKGKWALIRMKGKWAKESKPNWLLIKEHDEFEHQQGDEPITERAQNSVVTNRAMEEISQSEDHVWNSKDTKSSNRAWFRKEFSNEGQRKNKSHKRQGNFGDLLKDLPKESQPDFLPPELATMAEVPPSGAGWVHELKLDGYRIQARKHDGIVQMLTRTGLDWTDRVKAVAAEIAKLPAKAVTLDGELVVVSPNGTTSFANLQAAMQEGTQHVLTFFAFDLLHLDGKNIRQLPLSRRKEILGLLLEDAGSEQLRLSEHIETGGKELLREACKLQAEGIVSKRAASIYSGGRSNDWIKTKCLHEQEFVVGGYTLPTNGIRGVGALLLGYYRDGSLIYAGRTGTGFTQKTHRMLRERVEALSRSTSPFQKIGTDARKNAHWIKPELVVQVRFATWTADDIVRQAAFLGVREDKAPGDVVHEEASTSINPRRPRSTSGSAAKSSSTSPAKLSDVPAAQHPPIRLTHPDKVLDATSGMTKQMLADYYWQMAPYLLRGIKDRPVSLVRCPSGVGTTVFFQKHLNATLPKEVRGVDVPDKTGKIEKYITVDTPQALAALAQIGVFELHPWSSKDNDLERPDRMIFDLDPDEELAWDSVMTAAVEVRARLKKIGLTSFVKTTGGKGLHVVAPIKPELEWSSIKDFARTFAISIEKDFPDLYLTKMTKSARKGKIYLDYLRNERGATSVAAYSPRVRPEVSVSMPLSWEELQAMETRPVFRVVDFQDWKDRLQKDPWKEMSSLKQKIRV